MLNSWSFLKSHLIRTELAVGSLPHPSQLMIARFIWRAALRLFSLKDINRNLQEVQCLSVGIFTQVSYA